MCSKRWANPACPRSSFRDPTRYITSTAMLGDVWSTDSTIRSPFGSVERSTSRWSSGNAASALTAAPLVAPGFGGTGGGLEEEGAAPAAREELAKASVAKAKAKAKPKI